MHQSLDPNAHFMSETDIEGFLLYFSVFAFVEYSFAIYMMKEHLMQHTTAY